MAKSIIDLFTEREKDPLQNTHIAIKKPEDKTYYTNDADNKSLDEAGIKSLETKLSTKRYGAGIGEWGSLYNDAAGKNYSALVKKD